MVLHDIDMDSYKNVAITGWSKNDLATGSGSSSSDRPLFIFYETAMS